MASSLPGCIGRGCAKLTLIHLARRIFDDEHDWFRESVAAFVARELLPTRDDARRRGRVDPDVWCRAGELGFLGLAAPEEFGGSGIDDFRFNAILVEELAKAGMAYASCFGIHVNVVAPYLIELGESSQQERWLPRFCTGESIAAIAMTEPGAGSDLAGIQTTATEDGDGWRLHGTKTFITNGGSADLVVVCARNGPNAARGDMTLFVVNAEMPGFERGRRLEKIGQHESDTAELFFDGIELGPQDVLGNPGEGFAYMKQRLTQERLSAACENTAHAAAAIEQTLDYVKERQAFGRSIGSFQNSRFVMADLATRVDVTQAFVDRCICAHLEGHLDPTSAAKAKWWSSDVQGYVLDACLQLHGGYGYMQEYDVARAWADARVTRIWGGANEVMKELIGRSLGLGEPR